MERCRIYQKVSVVILFLFFWSSAQADLILTAPPRETAKQGAMVYGPLAAHLSTVLGETVTYKHPATWPRYQRDMRADRFDIVFDGPHFMSWREKSLGHTSLVRLPGELSFVVIVKSDDGKAAELLDLTYAKICVISPPNLSTLTMISQFGDTEPAGLKTINGGMNTVYKLFEKGDCRAAVLRDNYYNNRLTDEQRAETKVIYRSSPVVNQGITVSKRVQKKMHEKIVASLLDKNSGASPILKRFSDSENMVAVKSGEYDEFYKLLKGVIIGW